MYRVLTVEMLGSKTQKQGIRLDGVDTHSTEIV